jgi:hypothetical protein
MQLPQLQFRLRTLLALVALAALMVGGMLELIKYYNRINQPKSFPVRRRDGSVADMILYKERSTWYIGPISIGPLPTALTTVIFVGVAFVLSVSVLSLVLWAGLRYRRKITRSRVAEKPSPS